MTTHKKKCVCGHLLDVEEVYKQGYNDAINEMKSLIYEFDDYCDAMDCHDCWMNFGDESCLKQWIDRKFEQLKE